MAVTKLVLLFGLVAVAVAVAVAEEKLAITTPCEDVDQIKCTVGDVRINPCREKKPCIFKKGHDASMEFDFTPHFSTSNLKTNVYWPSPSGVDMPFAGLGSDDACLRTSCPTVAGTQNLFKYNLHVGKKLPSGSFQIKWKVWNADNVTEACCFKTSIILKK